MRLPPFPFGENFRKEERVREILRCRGDYPGLVHIFSALKSCGSFRPWHDKVTHQTLLKGRTAKCLHYYSYFVDKKLGLCYLRGPNWAPFCPQFYFNAHNWLANQLNKKGIEYSLVGNAFTHIGDFARGRKIADRLSVKKIHRALNYYARQWRSVVRKFCGGDIGRADCDGNGSLDRCDIAGA